MFLRVAVFVGPVIAFIVTKRICLSLQRRDRERLLHGSSTGVLVRDPSGGYSEAHVPITPEEAFTLDQREQLGELETSPLTDERGVRLRGKRIGKLRARLSRWYAQGTIAKPPAGEIVAAPHHGEKPEIPHSPVTSELEPADEAGPRA